MSEPFHWTCPFCDRAATINDSCFSSNSHQFSHTNKLGLMILTTQVTVCPNPSCREYAIEAATFKAKHIRNVGTRPDGDSLESWKIRPNSGARQFPDYIPSPILEDYSEACLIQDLSPKASATLARRCLQGMIRDFWEVRKGRLVDEIEAIADKTDKLTWEAIDAVRKIGNIGAHMEKDINLILEVDPAEAALMIELIESLLKDWYVARHDRQEHLAALRKAAGSKAEQKRGNAT